jgi:integrase
MNEKRERGTGRIFQRGNVLWIQYYDGHGQQIRMSAETNDPKKAAKLLRKKIGEVEAGVHKDTRHLKYEDLRDAFYQDYVVNERKSLRRDGKGNPRLDKVVRLDGFFEGYRASEIDADLIRKFIADQQAKGLASGSVNRSTSALRRMFYLAKEDGKLRDVPTFPMVKEARPRQGFFEREQYEKLFAVLPDYLRLPFSIGYFSGMREGEILGLEWAQVDFLHSVIRLRAGETKNDEAREVQIVPQLRALLVAQHARRKPACDYVCFRLDRKGHAVQVQGFRKAWYSSCIRAGLGRMVPVTDPASGEALCAKRQDRPNGKAKPKMTYEGAIFHDLRRSGARSLVHAGVPEKVAMQIGGWKTRSVFDRYSIVSPKDVAEAGRKLEAFHSQKVGDNSGPECTEMQQASSATN